MVLNQSTLKKNNYRNKLTNTKIITDSDNESDNESNTKNNNTIDIESDYENDYEYDYEYDYQLKLLNEKFQNYKSDLISQYIIQDKIQDFNSKSIFCYYLWSGIVNLDRWELNRKIDQEHVKKIYTKFS